MSNLMTLREAYDSAPPSQDTRYRNVHTGNTITMRGYEGTVIYDNDEPIKLEHLSRTWKEVSKVHEILIPENIKNLKIHFKDGEPMELVASYDKLTYETKGEDDNE